MINTTQFTIERFSRNFSGRIIVASALIVLAVGLFNNPANAELISYWAGEGNTGDVSGARNGTAVGTVNYTASVPTALSHSTQAFDLTGGGNAVTYDVTGGDSLSGTYTLSLWANPVSGTGATGAFFGTRGPSDTSFDAKFQGNTVIHGDIGNGTTWIDTSADATFDYQANTWHHIVYAVTPTGYTIYADGQQVNTEGFSGTPLLFDATHDIAIGANRASPTLNEVFDGRIDDVAIYDTELTATQVLALSLGKSTPKDVGKVTSISDLFNTGVDSAGAALGGGVDDPHYDLTVDPEGAGDATVPSIPGPWIANDADSRWIGPDTTANASATFGDYTYRTTFTLADNADLSSAFITGDWTSDNAGLDILINGVSTGQTNTGAFGTLFPFSITSSFVHGTNTLDFVVNNAGTSDNPTGLRVDNIQGAFLAIPEPATFGLAIVGLLFVSGFGWRRRSRTPQHAFAQRFPSHTCNGRDSITRFQKTPVAFACAAILCLLTAGHATAAGIFSSQTFTGDADSGVSTLKSYTHTVDLNSDDGGATINGVTFIAGGTSGANYTLANTTGTFQNNPTNVTGGAGDLLDDFLFIAGTSTAVAELTLTGLTPGDTYITTFYNDAFGSPGGRFQNITTTDGGAILFDQNFSGNDNGNLLQYTYTATGPSLTFSFDAVNNGASFHHYGFSNELAVPEPSAFVLAGLGLFFLGTCGWRRR